MDSQTQTTTPEQLELIQCPICHQEFDPDTLGLPLDERNRFLMGYRLQVLRAKAGLTLMVAAERIGVTHPALITWERGVKDLPLKRAVQLAQLYGVTVNDLIAGYRV
jgi:DNA-binding XRE family transcriptional regulator